ncbi:ethanolamine ammonia-lyase subunit EutC [Salmonella enterica]
MIAPDAWKVLREFTDARIALGRSGASLPTQEVLNFGLAHARARDAIHQPFDSETLARQLHELRLKTLEAHSAAADRHTYLQRPDLGRVLSAESRERLVASNTPAHDLLLVVGDGLSSYAVHRQAPGLISALRPYLETLGLSLGPVVLAHQSRVALGDDIGETLGSKAVAILIGERPGLSSPDSLGVYLTWQPARKRLESERNCISNIRPQGLNFAAAAFKLAWLLEQAFLRRLTGVRLKDESDNPALHGKVTPHSDFPTVIDRSA